MHQGIAAVQRLAGTLTGGPFMPPLSGEFYLIFRLKWGDPLISIRPLEIGLLQEAVIDENF